MVSQLHSLLLFMWWSIATHKIRRTHRDFIIIMRCRFAVCIIIIIMQCSFCSLHHHLAMCIVQFASSSMQNAYSLHKHAICTHDKVMHYHRPSMQKIWHITVLMTTIILHQLITITITIKNTITSLGLNTTTTRHRDSSRSDWCPHWSHETPNSSFVGSYARVSESITISLARW